MKRKLTPLWKRRPHFRFRSVEAPLVTGACNHEWLFMPRQPGETYTGYCERCPKCGTIQQIVQ